MINAEARFRTIEPKILYFGTPVALISSLNEDGTTNLAPMSSFWALGWTMMLGLLDETKTAENMERDAECVVNVPSPDMWRAVEKLAPLTGRIQFQRSKPGSFARWRINLPRLGWRHWPAKSCGRQE
jgi:flavin reductase (DIM6/NTAB) family NADH-FMN oxidoreductase RutF